MAIFLGGLYSEALLDPETSQLLRNAPYSVYADAEGTELAFVYGDIEGDVQLSQPLQTDSNGMAVFYTSQGRYFISRGGPLTAIQVTSIAAYDFINDDFQGLVQPIDRYATFGNFCYFANVATPGTVLTGDVTLSGYVGTSGGAGVTNYIEPQVLVNESSTDYTITVGPQTAYLWSQWMLIQKGTGKIIVNVSSGATLLSYSGGDRTAGPGATALLTATGDPDALSYVLSGQVQSAGTSGLADKADVAVFTPGTDTWSLPAGGRSVRVQVWGGGGGGGGGRRGVTASTRCGGGGGGGGGYGERLFDASDLPSSVFVYVGAAGTGATAQTTTSTNGNSGGNGGASAFTLGTSATDDTTAIHVGATGGSGGAGGTTSAGAGGAGGAGATTTGATGGSASTSGGVGGSGSAVVAAPGGGGAGGGITSGGSNSAGGAASVQTGGGAAASAGAIGVSGSPGVVPKRGAHGRGGGGGGAQNSGATGAGGAGSSPGAGGGGGGAGVDSSAPGGGAGGNGGAGLVIVTTYF